MKKDRKWFIDKWTKERNKTDVHDPMYHFINEFIADVSQLDEPEVLSQELPVIPQFVADEFDYNKNPYWEVDESKDVSHILKCAFGNEGKPSDFLDWVRENPEDYVMAVRNGCEVEEEPLYYALIKGHELVDSYDIYWNCDKSDYGVFVSRLHPPHDNFLTEMSKSEWNKLGINDSSADFVKVEE